MEGQMTHQKKAVQNQIKAKFFLVSSRSAQWLEIGDNLLKSISASGWIFKKQKDMPQYHPNKIIFSFIFRGLVTIRALQ